MAKKRKTLPKEIDDLLKEGNVEELKKLLSRCEPDARRYSKYGSNIFSRTPLPREFAIWAKEYGANVNFVDYYGRTPIFNHAGAYDGDVQLLIDLGADIHVTQHNGTTPLHIAATYGRVEATKTLLAAGAEVDARAESFEAYHTPLEMALSHNRVPFATLLEICTILLKHGAQITDAARQYVSEAGEEFQRYKRLIRDPEFFAKQMESLNHLYKLFGVEPVGEIPFHDGVSPIVIKEEGFAAQYNKLWDYLVPPYGQARTAQGEAIRIAGRVDDELMRNGGANWDGDYRKMLRIFPTYLRLGNSLSDEDVAEAERLAHILRNGQNDKESQRLCELAVKWILQNPEVIEPLEADYKR